MIAAQMGYVNAVSTLLSAGANGLLKKSDGKNVFDLNISPAVYNALLAMFHTTVRYTQTIRFTSRVIITDFTTLPTETTTITV